MDWVDVTSVGDHELLPKDSEYFKASAAPPEDYLKAYRKASEQSKSFLCVTIPAKLSTIYNVTQRATAIEGFAALVAVRATEKGKELAEMVNGGVQ
jgi:fatty acid-binding protein DegV